MIKRLLVSVGLRDPDGWAELAADAKAVRLPQPQQARPDLVAQIVAEAKTQGVDLSVFVAGSPRPRAIWSGAAWLGLGIIYLIILVYLKALH